MVGSGAKNKPLNLKGSEPDSFQAMLFGLLMTGGV